MLHDLLQGGGENEGPTSTGELILESPVLLVMLFADAELFRVHHLVLASEVNSHPSTASDIVEAAKPAESPLHRYFEWDDSKAAELYREDQARNLFRSIAVKMVNRDGHEDLIRAFHPIQVKAVLPEEDKATQQKSYTPLAIIVEDPTMRQEVVRDAKQHLIAFRTRFEKYQGLLGENFQPIFDFIKDLDG